MNRILAIQKKIYENLKQRAKIFENDLSGDLKKYQRNQDKFSKRKILKSTYQELLKRIKGSKIIYLGDFHTFDQNSKNLERITKYLIEKNNLIIGMEFIDHKYQIYVDHYLKGHLTELEFIESINYKNSWRFPWKRFQYFFSLARQKKIKIIALNSEGTLKQRDQVAAKILNNYQNLYPQSQFLILFGQLHLMPNKLPKEVQKEININFQHTIIHQNLDEVYWKTSPWDGKNKQIIKFNNDEYIIQTSAPWIKYESLLYWYENIDDDPDFDLHEYIIETGTKVLNSNSDENFIYIIEKLAITFNINKKNLNHDFVLSDHFDLNFILKKINLLNQNCLKQLYTTLLKKNDFFFLPNTNIFYCPNYSINRISYLAGIKLFIDINPSFSKLLKQKNNSGFFIYFLHIHYFAYIASKVINPHRKTDMAKDITDKSNQATYQLALQLYQMKSINDVVTILKGKSKLMIYNATKIFSFSIAEYIFEKVYNEKKKSYLKLLNFKIENNQFLEVIIINNILSKKEIHKKRKRYF